MNFTTGRLFISQVSVFWNVSPFNLVFTVTVTTGRSKLCRVEVDPTSAEKNT